MVGFRPELYKNWYGTGGTAEENEEGSTVILDDNISSEERINNNDQSVMAEIKSAPLLDLPLRSIW